MVAADHSMQEYHGENLHHYILTLMATVSWLRLSSKEGKYDINNPSDSKKTIE